NLASGFKKNGFDIDLILVDSSGPFRELIPKNIHTVDLKSSRVLYSLPKLVKYFRSIKPDVVISAMDHQNIVTLWAIQIAKIKAVKIITVHIDWLGFYHRLKLSKNKVLPFFMKRFYPWADYIIAVSRGTALGLSKIADIPLDRITVIYNPVVTPEIFQKAEEPLEHPWFFPDQPPVILGIGRLASQKDFETLIKAFKIVRDIRPSRLLILGEGEERHKLESLIKYMNLQEDVSLPGFVKNPYKYMKQASVFVLSSVYEGFANVLVEAMALGTSVVSTNCPSGPSEILENGRYGPLVDVGNPQQLAEAILKVLDNPLDRNILMQRGMEFSLDKITSQYINLFKN
ncbi:MAG: glycosyltransferase, partial [Candidatus Omnitrophica bacterium]|nr:glycosyltransferase [Candidatus Omnitrophota bacterium]